ncbi:hypothetical protein Pla175_16850 [Pirellulimonas nuda]|uniref:CNNM transmembrane domain-containing protein n=1 Tax=Pirellulimonas nuda TaxID=2528009 RepID=A0A518D9Z7_9BACT|nr:CNNM domain-containing protein [Pirellulimonas nuda]QDU88310.1 hypothetical protein Pla175_16850 [Pirellulimonas nuda]
MIVPLLLFSLGLALSAMFSGSETGFYRLSRLRLVIDTMAGDRISKGFLWAVNNPAAFVATVLVGNNVANYLASSAIVMACDHYFAGSELAGVLVPMAFSPLVFVYGELMPKNVFYAAPNRMLRRVAAPLAVAGLLFLPVSALLWCVGRLLQWVGRTPTDVIRGVIARRELAQALDEGHAVGLLEPVQRRLAQAIFGAASRSVREFMTPSARFVRASTVMSRRDVLRLARRQKQAAMPVEDPARRREIVGYVRAFDCLNGDPNAPPPIRPLLEFDEQTTFLSALTRMQSDGQPIALVRLGPAGRVTGLLRLEALRSVLTTDALGRGPAPGPPGGAKKEVMAG